MKKKIFAVLSIMVLCSQMIACGNSTGTATTGSDVDTAGSTESSAAAGSTTGSTTTVSATADAAGSSDGTEQLFGTADASNDSETVDTENATAVSVGTDYTAAGDIEFSLFKINTSGKLGTVSGAGSYYEADRGMNYVDIVLTLTNNGTEELSVRDIEAFFITDDGTRYDDKLVVDEERDDYLDQYGEIKPLSTEKVHIGYKLPTDVSRGNAFFQINGDLFVVEYDVEEEVSNASAISWNQEITVEDIASFELLSTEYTADVLPPNTSGFYTHYPVDDPTNDVYYVVYCDLTNQSASDIMSDDMISIRAIFDDRYEYTPNMVLEKKDGTGFDYASITSISPLETRKAVFMFEVPKKTQEMSGKLSIYFYGNEYICEDAS